jgi:hypothetical protein
MGRPQRYRTAADRQAAYRRRLRETTVIVDRQALARLHHRLEQLQRAIHQARVNGDPLAQAASAALPETMLEKLIACFQARAAALTPDAPDTIIY